MRRQAAAEAKTAEDEAEARRKKEEEAAAAAKKQEEEAAAEAEAAKKKAEEEKAGAEAAAAAAAAASAPAEADVGEGEGEEEESDADEEIEELMPLVEARRLAEAACKEMEMDYGVEDSQKLFGSLHHYNSDFIKCVPPFQRVPLSVRPGPPKPSTTTLPTNPTKTGGSSPAPSSWASPSP